MRVYKNGTYYRADIWIAGKKYRFSTGLTDRRKAQLAAEQERERLAQQIAAEEAAESSLALADIAARYMLHKGDHVAGASDIERLVNQAVKYIGPDKLITDITHEDMLRLRTWRRQQTVGSGKGERKISAYAVNDTIAAVKRLFTYMRPLLGHFPKEPRWKDLWLTEPREHVRELSATEADSLTAAMLAERQDYRPLIEFIRLTGKRKTACMTLRWEQVDWQRGVIEIKDKGAGGGKPVIIKITPSVRAILWPLQGQHEAFVFTYVAQRTVTQRNGRKIVAGKRYPITKDGLRKVWDAIRAEAGLLKGKGRFRMHDFRHDLASKALRKVEGAQGLKVVQQLLDHSDVAITLRTYAHLLEGEAADVMEALAQDRDGNRPNNRPKNKLKAI